MASPYSSPDVHQRPLPQREASSHSATKAPAKIPPGAPCSFSLRDDSPPIRMKTTERQSSSLKKVMSRLCHSAKTDQQDEASEGSETAQERRYKMRINSSLSNDAIDSREQDQQSEQNSKAKLRISAASKVNFIFLNEEEQIARYRNIRREYKALKKELAQKEKQLYNSYSKIPSHTFAQSRQKLSRADVALLEAREKLKETKFQELPDCQTMLQDLASCLATGAMAGDSVELSLICNLVRKVKMRISSKEGLSLGTKINSFLKQCTREELVSLMSGHHEIQNYSLKQPKTYCSLVPFQLHVLPMNFIVGSPVSNRSSLVAETQGSKVRIRVTNTAERAKQADASRKEANEEWKAEEAE